jgi:hypothetical protein
MIPPVNEHAVELARFLSARAAGGETELARPNDHDIEGPRPRRCTRQLWAPRAVRSVPPFEQTGVGGYPGRGQPAKGTGGPIWRCRDAAPTSSPLAP